jgi:hypothetical protein
MSMASLIKKILNYKAFALIIVSLSIFLVLCSFVDGGNKKKGSDTKKGESIFIFYSGEKQDKYEAVFSDGELKSLSKNGKALSKEEMKENEDLVYDEINDLNNPNDNGSNFVFHFDNKKFGEHMKHFSEEMKLFKPHLMKELDSIRIDFDTLHFNKNMRELGHNLAGLKNMRIKILNDMDEEDFDIPDIELNEKDFNIDIESINKELEKASEDIKKSTETIKNLDISGLTEKVKEEMKRADSDLKKSKKDLNNLHQFLQKIKEEMVKDKLIKNADDKINLKIEDGDIYVNDKKLSDEMTQKYKKIYEESFGHKMNHSFHMETEE